MKFDRTLTRGLYLARNWTEAKIHAGLHKTGSTSLQQSLRSAGLLQSSRRGDFRESESFREILVNANSKKRVVSSEHLLGEILDMYSTAPARFELLKTTLESSHTTLYMRPHTQWHSSAYSQIVQQGTELNQEDYEKSIAGSKYFSWARLADDLLTLSTPAARVSIRASGQVIADYAKILGVRLPPAQRRNPSLSPMAVEAFTRLTSEGFVSPHKARKALVSFMPESKSTSSVFSQNFQLKLIEMKEDWYELSETLSAFGQTIHHSWLDTYNVDVLPSAREIFRAGHLKAAKRHILQHLDK